MKTPRLLGSVVLFALAAGVRAADVLASDPQIAGVVEIAAQGKLVHAVRGVDHLIADYPADTRLPALRAQLVAAQLRDIPPQDSNAAPIGAAAAVPRPPIPTQRVAIPGSNFLTGTAAIAMIWIPAGTFFMSSTQGSDDDTWVTFPRGYWLGQTELTQEQWQQVMTDDSRPSYFKGSNRPVEWVAWLSAMDYCRSLTEHERAAGRLPANYEYTLPTEAQWEYACRAGTTGSFAGDLDTLGWYETNSAQQTHPVGEKQPNAWGLYDMHGNVWEWCLDCYGGYPGGHVIDPHTDNTGPNETAPRMMRGGGWNSSAGQCRSGSRYRYGLTFTGASLGFRVALTPVFERTSSARLETGGRPPPAAVAPASANAVASRSPATPLP